MRTILAVILVVGCAADGGGTPPVSRAGAPIAADLRLWAHNTELEALAHLAAARIEAASGLTVAVNDEMVDAMPMFWSESGVGHWQGLRTSHTYEYIAITSDTPPEALEVIVLHEILHALGGQHIGVGEGVLSPNIWPGLQVTAEDLESLCAAAACSRMTPEL